MNHGDAFTIDHGQRTQTETRSGWTLSSQIHRMFQSEAARERSGLGDVCVRAKWLKIIETLNNSLEGDYDPMHMQQYLLS